MTINYDVTNEERYELKRHKQKIKVHACGCHSGFSINMNLPLGYDRNFIV